MNGSVTTTCGVQYTFTAVAGKHVTLAITKPLVSPSGANLRMEVDDASGSADVSGVYINTTPTEVDFTPTADEAGATTVLISPYTTGATGSFTLTYATDVTGVLTSGTPVTSALKFGGQHADFTFTAVAGKHVTLAITKPLVSPSGANLRMEVENSSGSSDVSGVYINTTSTEVDFTPTADEAGVTTVFITPYTFEATGSFTLTYATDVTGVLTSGTPVTSALKYGGQHADFTFTAVAGKHVTLAITKPLVSPSGANLRMEVENSSGSSDVSGVYINTTSTEVDFTPTAGEAGVTTVFITPYTFEATGSFTLTYATDVTGVLTSGNAVMAALKYGGQHADYTFTAVAGKPVTLAITNPRVTPSGNSLRMDVYDSSGGNDASGVYINTSPAEIDFTPTADEAGPTNVVISPYSFETTGSFTLTCHGCASPPHPVVTSLSPSTGPVGGGTLVIVTGAGFTGATKVQFGSVSGTAVTVLNDATIAVLSPAEAAGTYDVTVTTAAGTSAAVTADTFKVAYAVPVVSGLSPKP